MKSLHEYIIEKSNDKVIKELEYELMTHMAVIKPKDIRYYNKLMKSSDVDDRRIAKQHLDYIDFHKSEAERIKKQLKSLGVESPSLI